jgi:uridine phosphorylase
MEKKELPILEYDRSSRPIVSPKRYLPEWATTKSDRCLITYFSDVVNQYEQNYKINQAFRIRTEGVRPRVYYHKVGRETIYVVPMSLGAPEAARVLEIMSAHGVKKFMVCGGAGTLDDSITRSKILLPVAAVRDEGTSYHYLPPAREVRLNVKVREKIEDVLIKEGEEYVKVKTWTTDAIFRETADKVALRKSEGCTTVEMECATFYSVGEHKGLLIGQLLYAGDHVTTKEWHYRDWHSATDRREKLFSLAIKCLMAL